MKKPYLECARLLVLLLFASPLFSQINFAPYGSPAGFRVFDLVEVADSVLFMSCRDGVFSSRDSGDSWQTASKGLDNFALFSSKDFAVTSDGVVFLQFNYGLYRFNFAEERWDMLPAPDFSRMTIDSQNRLWLAGNDGATLVSEDGGSTYIQVLSNAQVPGSYVSSIAVWNDEHGLIYTSSAVYHFNRNGQLQPVNLSSNLERIEYHPKTGVAYAQQAQGNFFRSLDGGLSWSQVSVNSANLPIAEYLFDPNGGIYAWVHDGKLYHSADNGTTWQAQNSSYTYIGSLNRTLLSKSGQLYYYGYNCSQQAMYRSSDLGRNWTELQPGLMRPEIHQIVQNRQGTLFVAGCANQNWKYTSTLGNSWEKLKLLANQLYFDMQIGAQGAILSYTQDSLGISTDNGQNWALEALPAVSKVPGGTYILKLRPDGILYAFYSTKPDNKLHQSWMSVDEGKTWKPMNIPAGSAAIWSLPKFHPNGDLFFLTDTSGNLVHYRTKLDSTRVVSLLPSPFFLNHIDSRGYMYFFRVTNPSVGLYVSKDLGATATHFFLPQLDYLQTMVSNLDGHLFIQDNDEIFISKNSGASWTSVLKRGNISTLHISPDQYLYVGFSGDTLLRSTEPTAYRRLISGQVWLDQNDDCELDAAEQGLAYARITATSAAITRTGYSDFDGHYVLSAPPGDYLLQVEPPNAMQSPCFADWPVALPVSADTAQADLPLRILAHCPYMTVAFSTPFLRRCFENIYRVRCCNAGTATAFGATVELQFDSLLEVLQSTLPFQAFGQNYSFALGDLPPGACLEFDVRVKVSCLVELGHEHCVTAHIYPDTLCLAGLDTLSVYTECRRNIGSFDPNDKQAFVTGREASESVDPGVPLEYLIRFQNTGTDTAFRVVVEDRISPWLDLTTLRVEAASHPYRLEEEAGRLLRFVFENILLPDSNINEAASHGFIKFKIAQVAKVPKGATLTNRADIFFDFNEAVRTNVSRLTVGKVGPPFGPGDSRSVLAYPNPFSTHAYLIVEPQPGDGAYTLRVFDALGRLARQEQYAEAPFYLERRGLPAGLYYFMVETASRRVGSGKLLAH